MSFGWSEYLDLVSILLNCPEPGLEEAYYRSSISRAYYGVFCLARDMCGLKNYRPQNRADLGVHQKVISHYRNSSTLKDRQIGLKLDELRRYRNNADYDGDNAISAPDAERAYIMALEVLQLLWV